MLRSGRRKQPNQAASLQQCELAHDMKWSVGVSWHLGRKGIDCNPRGIDCAIGCATACATDCGNAVDMGGCDGTSFSGAAGALPLLRGGGGDT